MKKILILKIICLLFANSTFAQVTINYQPDTLTNILNPERGWFHPHSPYYYENITAEPFTLAFLQNLKATKQITLVRKIYLLYDFKTSDISQAYLDIIASDLALTRQAGMKLIVRFAYVWNLVYAPGSDEDASISWILRHISQLKPILNANADVIDHINCGFIGRWGEMHTSVQEHVVLLNTLFSASGLTIANAVLDSFPQNRSVSMRYDKQIKQIGGNNIPIDSASAFTNTKFARTGWYNDGLAYNETDFGTWSENPDERIVQQEYNRTQGIYTIVSGEAAEDFPYTRLNYMRQLKEYHFTSVHLHLTYGDASTLIPWLKTNGQYEIISRKLGYQLRLISSTLAQSNIAEGGNLQIDIKLKNEGWAAPHNPRLVEIILRNDISGAVFKQTIETEPRHWLAGKTQNLNINFVLPENLPLGKYALLLNLPDPMPSIYNRSEYAIRLANQNMWESTTGYNNLEQTIIITNTLSISLTTFTAKKQTNTNLITWQTKIEQNNDNFELERSLDGAYFTIINTQKSKGNSTNPQNYSYNDNQITANTVYYRLKQTDFDGKSEYSKIISLKADFESKLSVYPNPFTSQVNISASKTMASLKIIGSNGQTILSKKIKQKSCVLAEAEFGNGFYILEVVYEDGNKEMVKLIKL